MKKLTTFFSLALWGTFSLVAQHAKPVTAPIQVDAMQTENLMHFQRKAPLTLVEEGGSNMKTNSVTVTKLLTLPNAFGYSATGQKQLTAYPELNTVAFLNRQDPNTYGGGITGDLRYTISTDKGLNWSNTSVIGGVVNTNAVSSGPARYPNSILFTNGGNSLANLKLHTVAPTVDPASGSGWTSLLQLTIQSPTTNSAYASQELYSYDGQGVFYSNGNITERIHNSGEFWMVCTSSITANNQYIYALKGYYDATLMAMVWEIKDSLTANWMPDNTGALMHSAASIAFSPDGTKGYVVAMGDIEGGRDSIFQPVIWEFNGSTFDNAYEVDINIPDLNNYILQWADSAGTPLAIDTKGMVTCGRFDLTVDYLGNPHIMATVLAAATSGQPYFLSSGGYMREMDIHKQGGNWNFTQVARQLCFREVLPNTTSANADLTIDPQPMLSRSLDGKFLFYTWTDTDTTGATSTDNVAPDFWGRMLDVSTGLMTDSINWTLNDPNWHTKSRIAKTSEYVFETTTASACGRAFEVPTSIIDFSNLGNVGAATNIYYFSDISYKCEDATHLPSTSVGIKPTSLGIQDFKAYPNPTKDVLHIEINLAHIDNITITLVNLNGQTVLSKSLNNTAVVNEHFNVESLPSGLYFLQVSNSKGTQAQKVVVE